MNCDGRGGGFKIYDVIYVLVLAALVVLGAMYMRTRRVAVLDTNAIAEALGVTERATEATRRMGQQSEKRLEALRLALDEQSGDLDARIKAATTEAEKDELIRKAREQRREFQTYVARERQKLAAYRTQVTRTFRRRLAPFVEQEARRRRLDVVLERPGNVFYAHARADITDAVIESSRSAFPPDMPMVEPEAVTPSEPAETNDLVSPPEP